MKQLDANRYAVVITLVAIAVSLSLALPGANAGSPIAMHGGWGAQVESANAEYASLKAQAEQFHREGSYAKAYELYKQASELDLGSADTRWVEFRVADTQWRAQAGSQTVDSSIFDEARKQLETLIATVEREEDRDLPWAEANESLGDFWWERRDSQNWGGAWPRYQLALEWWAQSSDLEAARRRYLHIVWTMAEPTWHQPHWYSHHYSYVPLEVLDNALRIAASESDQARASYLIALTLRNRGDWASQLRIPRAFEGALAAGRETDWYDDVLFAYAEWLMNHGPATLDANGQWRREADFIGAVTLFQRLTHEFAKGQTRYYDQAIESIKQITNPNLQVAVSNIFLPGSEIQFHLNWRNLSEIKLSLHRVDLTSHVRLPNHDEGLHGWINHVDLSVAEQIHVWSKATEDKNDHKPGQFSETLEKPLDAGAYVIQVTSADGKVRARDLILVSDATVIVKTAKDRIVAFVCDALSSKPMANATVRIWKRSHDGHRWVISEAIARTDDQGLCSLNREDFKGPQRQNQAEYLVTIAAERAPNSNSSELGTPRQAFAVANSHWSENEREKWRIYAFTDRPAYRPEDSVQWKIIARTSSATGGDPNSDSSKLGTLNTPADQILEYEITDPQGTKIETNRLTLNAFGSAWGAIQLSSSMMLGEYRIAFYTPGKRDHIGNATLFRLEEYKLPEFKVSVSTPQENGRRKSYRLGDTVELAIQSDYYFGGPVSNASVEVVVYQKPFHHWWSWPREYPWCYEDPNSYRYWWGGHGQVIKRETIRTDREGSAVLRIETPLDSQQDLEYTVEARVIDASRREITATGTVRVARRGHFVHARPKHHIHRPGDKAEIEFKAMDANQQPISAEGHIKVTREQWTEIWIDPAGKEIAGAALRELQARAIFPPSPGPNDRPWRLKFRGYVAEDVLTTTVKLDADGNGTFAFTPQKEGFYQIMWRSSDPGRPIPVTTSTGIYVANTTSSDLGMRQGQLELIVDKDTFRAGEVAPVMIVAPTNDCYVLLCVEGNDLYSHQLVHVSGAVKLVQLQIDERHIPNIYLNATMAHAGEMHSDTEEVVVPPVQEYLTVEIAADRPQYQPGEEGMFTILTKNHQGKPVSAEVALSVADESVFYIQQELAGDPRQFFFQQRQSHSVQTTSTFQQKRYAKLVRDEKDAVIDERMWNDQKRQAGMGGGEGFFTGGDDELNFRARRELDRADASGITQELGARAPAASAGRMAMSKTAALKDGGIFGDVGEEPARLSEGQDEPAVQVRTDFRATLLWEPSIITNDNGTATVKLKYADSLTGWKATARVASKGNQFGIGSTLTRTKMPLIARLQAPRFFLVGDIVTISGLINNNTDEPMTVRPQLEAEGLNILGLLRNGQPIATTAMTSIDIAANGEARIDWQLAVASPGTAKLKLTARGPRHADGMEKSFTVYEHGVEKFIAKSGKVRGNDVTITLDIPAQRKRESTVLAVQVTPSMAVTMLDALPYLIDYPYGCTEQTMSRFLPAAITAKTLHDLGLDRQFIINRMFGGIEPAHVGKTHPKGKKDLSKLDAMTQASLERLYDFQHTDGGWGWWKLGDSDHFMSAYVLWGLALARDAGLDVRRDVIDRAVKYLNLEIVEAENAPDLQGWMLHALSSAGLEPRFENEFQSKAFDNLWTKRDKLNAYTRALLALSAHQFGQSDKAKILVQNLENGVQRDARPDASLIVKGAREANAAVIGTAHWGEDGLWWRWSDGGVEATAFVLRAMLAIDPKNPLIEPTTNWLIKNRRGAQWSNTRDTAIVVLAMNEYLRTSGELAPDLEYELLVNDASIARRKVSAGEVLSAPSRFEIDPSLVRDGANEIRIVRKGGDGPIYFAADATFFSLEEPIPAAGNEIFVRREYYKLVPRPTLLKGYVYDRLPLGDGESVRSGERVEVVITVEAKNNYEYLVFEDLKPAGLEAVAIRSGEPMYARQMKARAIQRTFGDGSKQLAEVRAEQAHGDPDDYTGRSTWVYQELRDRKVALFISDLPQGVWELRYDLRAETPGNFHALPVLGHAMYVPEIRANGAEVRISVIGKGNGQ